MNKKLTFGKLETGDHFIDFLTAGDNNGHGGYCVAYHVYIKVGFKHAVCTVNGAMSEFQTSMNAIKLSN